MSKIPESINDHVDKHISTLCPFSLGKNDGENHCAHFVGHVLQYKDAKHTCKNSTWNDLKNIEGEGSVIRVDDIFNKSKKTGKWADKPASMRECLIFVTVAANVTKRGNKLHMGAMSSKHIGIVKDGTVWHYGNTSDKVKCEQVSVFMTTFKSVYGRKGTVNVYFGEFL